MSDFSPVSDAEQLSPEVAAQWTWSRSTGAFAVQPRLADMGQGLFALIGDEVSAIEQHLHVLDAQRVRSLRGAALRGSAPVRLSYRVHLPCAQLAEVQEWILPEPDGTVTGLLRDMRKADETTELHRELAQEREWRRGIEAHRHQDRNALATIAAALDMLDSTPLPVDARNATDHAMEAMEKLTASFERSCEARPSAPSPRVIAGAEVLEHLREITDRFKRPDIDLRLTHGDLDTQALVDLSLLEDILCTVLGDICAALTHGGYIGVSVDRVSGPEAVPFAASDLPAGKFLRILIQDERELPSDGQPLDLAPFSPESERRVRRVARSMDAAFWQGHYGEDSVICALILPEVARHPILAPRLPEGSTIMFVEDEAGLCRLTADRLCSAGYKVRSFLSADDARSALETEPLPDLLVTDVVMDGILQGPDLAVLARRIAPHMPVIFVSAETPERVKMRTLHTPGCQVLTKPTSRDALLQAIARAGGRPQRQRSEIIEMAGRSLSG